ncbi:MAG: hypothetical protein ACTHMY_24850 [Solirubrobacteraceae bacterium]
MSVRGAAGTLALLAAAAVAIAGCGGSAGARPVPKPLTVSVVPYKQAPPQLPAGHPAGALYVLDLTNIGHAQPATLAFASHGILKQLRWSSWGGSVAVAHGTAVLRSCKPDCATGPLVSYPGTVKLTGLKACDGARFYVDSSVVADTKTGPWRLASFMRNPCGSGL